jgi:hypothetical protein
MALTVDGLITDFTTYLDLETTTIDTPRARLLLDLVLRRAAAIVSPVPDAAKPLVFDVAGRAYVNPHSVTQEQVGGMGQTFATTGVHLTRRERADLRRLRGPAGAFTVNPIAPAT